MGRLFSRQALERGGTSEVPLSGWWLLAADQAPLKARALCWAMSRFAGWYPNPASLPWVLVKPPQGHTATALPFPWGSLPQICSLPARQGCSPTEVGTHPWGPPACALCLGRRCKLHPVLATGSIRKGSKGLMKTDWQPPGRLILKRLSAMAVWRAALI